MDSPPAGRVREPAWSPQSTGEAAKSREAVRTILSCQAINPCHSGRRRAQRPADRKQTVGYGKDEDADDDSDHNRRVRRTGEAAARHAATLRAERLSNGYAPPGSDVIAFEGRKTQGAPTLPSHACKLRHMCLDATRTTASLTSDAGKNCFA